MGRLMKHDTVVAGNTVDIETAQLLIIKRCLYHTVYVITSVSIFNFPTVVRSFIHSCYQSQSIHTQPIITHETTPYSLKRCLCSITSCNYKCVDMGHFPNTDVFFKYTYFQTE